MAQRDRLGDFQQQGRSRGRERDNDYYYNGQASEATLVPMVAQNSQSNFFQEIDEVKRTLQDVDGMIPELEQLHAKALLTVSQEQTYAVRQDISDVTQAIEARIQRARKLIGRLDAETKGDRSLTRSDRTARIQQQKRLITNLQSSLQRFRAAESQFSGKYRERIKRQYRIVNPMSTERELDAQVDNFLANPSSQTSIFAQSMLSQSRQQLSAAQSDADAMRRLESSIGELAQAFQDLQTLLASQDEQLDHVEERVEVAVEDIKQGAQEVVQAKEIRKSTRKKLWFLLICVIILLIVVALVAWQQICGGFRVNCGR